MKTLSQLVRFIFTPRMGNRGQSMAETALFLPILVVMLLGIVEVSTLLINQNRVTTAGRIAAGYGAANFDGTNWNEVSTNMGVVARNTVTDTLDLSPELWDIWSVYAQVNGSGTAFSTFNARHVYGDEQIVSTTDWANSVEAQVRDTMLAELQAGGGSISNLEVVVSIPYHNSATFLNLPIWQWVGFKTVGGLTAMRVDKPAVYAGCAILPIAVRINQPSAYPTDWPSGPNAVRHPADDGTMPMFHFPAPDDFDQPPASTQGEPCWRCWDPPEYTNESPPPKLTSHDFPNNTPGIPISLAQSGYVYLAREGTSAGGFGWVTWNGAQSQQALEASLAWSPPPPGNFPQKYPGSAADLGQLAVAPNASSGNGNGVLEREEWIQINTGNVQVSSNQVFKDYVFYERPVTLLVYDEVHAQGQNAAARVVQFVTVQLIGVSTTGNDKWMLFEYISDQTQCLPTPPIGE